MKNLFLSIIFTVFALSLFSQTAGEQELKAYMRSLGYSYADEGASYLSEGESAYLWRKMYSGNDYAILAYSLSDYVKDVDIYLYDNDGSLLKKSTSSDEFEILEYSPYTSRNMKIVIKNYDSTSAYTEYKCSYMLFYK